MNVAVDFRDFFFFLVYICTIIFLTESFRIMRKFSKINLIIASLLSVTSHAADLTTEKIDVISVAPLPSLGIPANLLPNQVQTIKSQDLEKSQSLDLTDYMNRNLSGVYINENQGNPLQPDLNFRGYTASPLLGTPQGLSVYVDGVRLNEAFGDVVNWNLIPKNAIYGTQLYSGSNPLFGLNTLGGAISIQTKNGRNSPGGSIQLTSGSFGRNIGEFEYGGVSKDNAIDYFVAATWFNEDGWRDHSNSDNKQLFTKIGWQGEKTDLKLTYSYVDGDLKGNGASPSSWITGNSERVYTWPDQSLNKTHFANLEWSHFFKDDLVLNGNGYYRNIRSSTLNGDLNDNAFPSVDTSPTLSNTSTVSGVTFGSTAVNKLGATIYRNAPVSNSLSASRYTLDTSGVLASGSSSFNSLITEANRLQQCTVTTGGNGWGNGFVEREPGEKCTGLINRTSTAQDNFGIASQLSGKTKLFNLNNNYVVGAAADYTKFKYKYSQEFGTYLDNGSVMGSGYFADYSQNGQYFTGNGEILDSKVDLKGHTSNLSIFGSDTLEVNDRVALTAALRYNNNHIVTKDNYGLHTLDSSTNADAGNAGVRSDAYVDAEAGDTPLSNSGKGIQTYGTNLSGRHRYQRLNPAIGLAFNPNSDLNFFASYSEGSRAPTAIELGCSDPAHACKLPSAMVSDPDLKQVISRTWEAGTKFKLNKDNVVTLTYFDSRNSNDIMFVATTASGNGYFKNFGETERQGATIGASQAINNFMFTANYTYLDATYESEETVISNANSSGTLHVSGTKYGTSGPGSTYGACPNGSADFSTSGSCEYYKTIDIKKGNRLVLTPRNVLKLGAFYRINDKWSIGADSFTASNQLLRGNENGQDSRGVIGGYTNVNLTASFKPASGWTLFGKVNNLFDKQFATAGSLGMNGLDANGRPRVSFGNSSNTYDSVTSYAVSEAFIVPGAPISAWVGLRYDFGGKKSSLADKD